MKKILLLVFTLLLVGCGDIGKFEEISRRIDNERGKLDGLFPEERIVRIVTFIDFGSPFCKQTVKILKELKDEFITEIDITYKHFPLESDFKVVAEAAECARNQGKFKDYLESYFDKYFDSTDPELLLELAMEQELSIDEFETCLDSHSTLDRIALDIKEAKKYRASETPFFILNDNIQIPGAIPKDTFQNLIKKLLNKAPDSEETFSDGLE